MSKSIYVSKKQFSNLKSGQSFWEICIDQYGGYSINFISYVGKKTNSYVNEPDEKSFFCKRTQLSARKMRRSNTLIYPVHKLFWSKKSADRFAVEHINGQHDIADVCRITKRVRTGRV